MGTTPQQKGITIEFDCHFRVCVAQSSFSSIMKAFLMLLPQLLEDFFQKVLVGFGEYEMTQERKSFACQCCGSEWGTEGALNVTKVRLAYYTMGLMLVGGTTTAKWRTLISDLLLTTLPNIELVSF